MPDDATGQGPPTFAELLAQARGGDPEALGLLLAAHWPWLRAIAENELGADLRARLNPSDVVQQSLASACAAIGDFRGGSEAELLAWLAEIVRRNAANLAAAHRAQKRDVKREVSADAEGPALTAPTASPSDLVSEREQQERLEQALSRLPDEHRDVLRLRYWDRLSWDEIGARLGRSAAAARQLRYRALQLLRGQMRDADDSGAAEPTRDS
jgi:RNA polymerase sigma-70 factor (ECF subfamily)